MTTRKKSGAPVANEDAPSITQEQLEAYQRKLQVEQQQALHQCIADLKALSGERGFEIIAVPQFTQDGRVSAEWGVIKRT